MSLTTVNICRTCLSTDGELISLFSGISDNAHLTNKIMNISDITINKKDGLPYMICKKCVFLVESFDCFKKQIESANQRIKNFWHASNKELEVHKGNFFQKIGNFVEEKEEEYDESDYEIQYISDEVKKKVEIAFKRKQEIARQTELAKIYMTLRNYGDIILIPIKDTINEKKTLGDCYQEETNIEARQSSDRENTNFTLNVTSHSLFQFSENCLVKNIKDNQSNVHRTNESHSAEFTKMENFYNDEAETIQSANSDCNERLTIEVEESDNTSAKKHECEYAETEEKFERPMVNDAKQKKLDFSYDLEKNLALAGNSKDKALDHFEIHHNEDKKDIARSQNEKFQENYAWLRNIFYNRAKTFFDSTKDTEAASSDSARRNMEENVVESLGTKLDEQVHSSLKIVEEGNVKEDFSNSGKPHFYNEQVTSAKNLVKIGKKLLQSENVDNKNEREVTTTDDSFGIVEETITTDKFHNNEETMGGNEKLDNTKGESFAISNNVRNKDLHSEVPDRNEMEIEKESEKIDHNDEDRPEHNDGNIEIRGTEKSMIIEKPNPIEDKFVDMKIIASQEENSKAVINHEKNPPDNGTSDKSTSDDKVIVISSDTSDEERRKNHLETANRGVPLLSQRARKKLFQSRVQSKKNQTCQSQNRKITNEAGKKQLAKEPKNFQPKKYFQCTNCKINLYSVSAVLYHHNQIHTPIQESLSCQMCDVKYPTKPELYAHFDQHVESHLFRCNFCTCEFVLKKNLHTHMNAHMKPKIEEPENKRPKFEEPSEVEIPANENVVDIKNNETLMGDHKMEADGDTIDRAKVV